MLLEVISFTALSSTFGFFICGAQICYEIKKKGNTEGIGAAPFLIAFISCAFMLQYGILKEDNVIILCNVVGFALQTLYIMYYYYKTRQRRYLRRVIIGEVAVISAMLYMVNWGGMEDNGIEYLGNMCMVLNIGSIAAPLCAVGEVIRKKSAESLPLPLCIASFLVSVQWLTYGILVDDNVIKIPNYVATFLSTVQLSLFVIYGRGGNNKYSSLDSRPVNKEYGYTI